MKARSETIAYWSEQNTLWESSGLAQAEFCQQQGLGYKRFVYWRGRIVNQDMPQVTKPKLLKVTVAGVTKDSQTTATPTSSLEVILPTGVRLYIKAESEISHAVALIKLLGSAL